MKHFYIDPNNMTVAAPTLRLVIENFQKFAKENPEALDMPVVAKMEKGHYFLTHGMDHPCLCSFDSKKRKVESFVEKSPNAVCIGN